MILNSEQIRSYIQREYMISEYKDLDIQLQPNGFDLTINIKSIEEYDYVLNGNFFRVNFDNHLRSLPDMRIISQYMDKEIVLKRGCYLFKFNEYLKLPSNVMAECKPRSTMLRGLCDIRTAYWDRGFEGESSGLLIVYETCNIFRDARVAQMKFETLEDDGNTYDGIYKNEKVKDNGKKD